MMIFFISGEPKEKEGYSMSPDKQQPSQSDESEPYHGSSPMQISRVRIEKISQEKNIQLYQLDYNCFEFREKNRTNHLKIKSEDFKSHDSDDLFQYVRIIALFAKINKTVERCVLRDVYIIHSTHSNFKNIHFALCVRFRYR